MNELKISDKLKILWDKHALEGEKQDRVAVPVRQFDSMGNYRPYRFIGSFIHLEKIGQAYSVTYVSERDGSHYFRQGGVDNFKPFSALFNMRENCWMEGTSKIMEGNVHPYMERDARFTNASHDQENLVFDDLEAQIKYAFNHRDEMGRVLSYAYQSP